MVQPEDKLHILVTGAGEGDFGPKIVQEPRSIAIRVAALLEFGRIAQQAKTSVEANCRKYSIVPWEIVVAEIKRGPGLTKLLITKAERRATFGLDRQIIADVGGQHITHQLRHGAEPVGVTRSHNSDIHQIVSPWHGQAFGKICVGGPAAEQHQ